MADLATQFDEFLNNREGLLGQLRSLGIEVSADNISSGVFGAVSNTTGITFGTDPTTDKSYLQSRSFVSGTTGWQILSDGTAQFMSITLTGGTIKYGKTSFTDSINAGYYVGSEGIYFGAASDTTKLKYTISGGAFDFIGTVSSRSTATLASAIDSAGAFINANLDTSAKTILSDFTFGVSGAIKMITDANNGLWISPTGILGKKLGVNTFTIGIDGTATFAGTLSGASGTFGTITAGTISGVTITGSTLQTGATGQNINIEATRIALRNDSTELGFMDSSGAFGGGFGLKNFSGTTRGVFWVKNANGDIDLGVDPGGSATTDLYLYGGDSIYVVFNAVSGQNFSPSGDNIVSCGTAGDRWSDVRSVLINGADYCFENGFRITEEKDFGISFYNPKDEKVMTLDKEGNLWLRGSIYQDINMKKRFPFYRKGALIKE